MAGLAAGEEVLTRRGRLIAGGLGVAAAAVAGWLLYRNRLELFVLPERWSKVLELEERARGKPPPRGELSAALEAFLELQRVRFGPGVLSLERVWTHEGYLGYVLVHMPTEATPHGIRLVLLDSRGRPVGDPMPAAKANDFQGHKLVHEDAYPYDIVRVNGIMACSDHSADRRGIVQRGLVLHGLWAMQDWERPWPVEIPVSSGVSREVRHWLLADSRPLVGLEAIQRLLASPREPDLFRALHEIERLGARGAGLARPLLAHESPDVRARAAAVLGNHPALGGELAPLARDPSEKVKMAALFALLNAEEVLLARSALLDLIGKRLDALYSDPIDFDVDRLMSPEVVTAVLAWSRGKDAIRLEYLVPFLSHFRRDHIRPIASALVRHFKEVEAEPATGDNTLRILAWLLALTDAEESDRVLADMLSRGTLEEDALGPVDILHALLHRKTRLHGANPETVLVKVPDSLWRESLLLQVWWGIPGALERLSKKIREAPDREWLQASDPYSFFFSLDDPENYVFEGALELGFIGDGSHALWRRHTPPALLPLFIELASRDPEAYLDFAAEVLRAQAPETLRSIEKDLVRLCERAEHPKDLLVTAAKAATGALDPWLVKGLEVLPEWWDSVTLWGLLRYRGDRPGQQLSRAAEQVAGSAGDPAHPLQPDRDEIRKDQRAAWRTNIVEGRTWWRASTWDGIMDPQLAANILLVRWNVPGARERLLAKLHEPGNDWIFDFLWEEFLPPSFVPDLKELAERGSSELADRVEYLLSCARKREEKAAAKRP